MGDQTTILATAIATAGGVAGLAGFLILAPKPWDRKSRWFVRSLLASCAAMSGLLIVLLAVDVRDVMHGSVGANGEALSALVWSIITFVVPVGIFLTIGMYLRVLMWSKRDDFMRRKLGKPSEHK